LKIQDGGSRHPENHKNRDISTTMGLLTALTVKKIRISQIQDG